MKYQMADWENEMNCSSGEIEELMAREKANENDKQVRLRPDKKSRISKHYQ